MLQQQQNSIPARQVRNNSYSSPSYPSPSMSAYAYPPPNGQTSEQYQGSPTSSPQSLPPGVNLPPLRTMDARSASQQPGQTSPAMASQPPAAPHQPGAMGSPLPPPIAHMPQHYYPNIPPPGHPMADPNLPMRYPLAPDNRMMSGGRHKKEIKRRTKTGCLTCRKRRIKCDEAHPTCRNCTKSKRECLGYDPIFKAQPGPAAIQPAPSSAPSMQGTSVTSSPYPAPPQGYMPVAHQPYGPTVTADSRSPPVGTEHFDYSAAIDPALEGSGVTQPHGQHYPFETSADIRPGATKPVNVADILAVSGIPPPTNTSLPPLTSNQYNEIRQLYVTIYASGIDKMLETRWFTTRCIDHLVLDYRLCEQFSIMMSRFQYDPNADIHARAVTQSLEATVVWGIMNLARTIAGKINSDKPADKINIELDIKDGVEDAAARLNVLEKLITNHYLEDQPALPAPDPLQTTGSGTKLDDQLKYRERQFWHLISNFLTLKDDEKGAEDILTQCRSFLDSRENRDVIYSVAVARHIGARMLEAANATPNGVKAEETTTENGELGVRTEASNGATATKQEIDAEEKQKLAIAKRFIEEQARGKGTTQVVQRVCGMILRAWGGSGLRTG